MKKILNILSVIAISAPLGTVVACKKMFGTDLSKIGDFDWSENEPYFKSYSNVGKVDLPNDVKDLGQIKIQNRSNYMNIGDFNTGFNTDQEIMKQAATGVPLNSKFLPNGQALWSVKLIEKKDYYTKINKLVNWNYKEDYDAKYNTSRISLQETAKVKTKWVESQDASIQEMNMSTIIPHTSAEHTIIGQNRTYERSFNNYQYNDVLVSWSGAIDEGIIIPAAKNQVEKAHLNGTKILGNIFLDGYHGLTKEKLRGFLEKDDAGNYKVVDVLINIATQLGFDGWFWNNEPNGAQPNGSIVDYRTIIEVMEQLHNKIKTSTDQKVKDLLVFGYRNQGTLSYDNNGKPGDVEANEIWKNTSAFLNDFYKFPAKMKSFMKDNGLIDSSGNPTADAFKVFNMINAGAWVDGQIYLNEKRIGTTDFRQLTHVATKPDSGADYDFTNKEDDKQFIQDYLDGNWNYQKKAINSLAIFAAQNANDLAEAKLSSTKSAENDTYGLVYANNYDDMLYTGRNKSLSDDDKGVSYYPNPELDEKLVGKSSGVGNLIQEKTTLVDSNKNFKTNFSTGQGNMFNTLNSDGSVSSISNYPWSNTNIADTQPTYKWKVSTKDGALKASDNVSGYYDYYNPYLKGNSIALGGGYDSKGNIIDASFGDKKTFDWTIMGADYSAKNRTVEMVVKLDENKISKNTLTLNITTAEGAQKKYDTTLKDQGSGWVKISAEVNDQISQIGLGFTTKAAKAKINVGQLEVKDTTINKTDVPEAKISSEYLVERNQKNNIRLNFENILDDNVNSYYEIYQKNTDSLTMVGQSNANNYYIKNIDSNISEFYIKTINKDINSINWIKFKI